MVTRVLIFFFLIFLKITVMAALPMPTAEQRENLFNKLVLEINRLDGEGLIPRHNRPEDWKTTTDKLRLEARQAKTLADFGHVFKKLDATYPNFHGKVYLHNELDAAKTSGRVKFNFKIQPDLKSLDQTEFKYFIRHLKKEVPPLKNGDEVLAINGLPIANVHNLNFIYCKFPLNIQCATDLTDNLRKEFLNWKRNSPLELTVQRQGEKLTVRIRPEIISPDVIEEEPPHTCEIENYRYKDYELEYKGHNLCGYKKKNKPDVLVLRIKSFSYNEKSLVRDLYTEVDFFWQNYWKKNSGQFKTIIFDVIGNGGGSSPAPYYALFTRSPYQEQYTQFKKIKEFERKDIFDSVFWGDNAKGIWFKNIKADGTYAKIKEGDFLPPVPQFCADQKKDCRHVLFPHKEHDFKGTVKILVDPWCISSCVGFVDNMNKLFKGRIKLYGQPDSGDSAYSRAAVLMSLNQGKVKAQVATIKKARNPDPPEPWIRQIVSVTRTTDQDGNILSGVPQKMDFWIPRPWFQSDDEWSRAVFEEAELD